MTDVSNYQILDEFEWILKRPDSMVGSLEHRTSNSPYIDEDGKVRTDVLTYSPALLKIFDEIIQNSYDHSKRPEGKHLNKIVVTISKLTGEISVQDNGGIPVVEHPEFKMYVPTMIFGNLRGSSNFNDEEEREGAGRNGLGSKLTNVFSTYFMVDTADGKNRYERVYENNMRDQSDEVITPNKNRFTRISFIPDWENLKTEMNEDNYRMLVNRVYEIAACSPHIQVSLNGKNLNIRGFESYVKTFDSDALFISNDHWRIGLSHSKDSFQQISFVNSTRTGLGGTHIDYIANQLVDGVREHVKKKTKQDIKPGDIKNHFFLFIDCTVYNPRFNSQTKEFMNLAVSSYGTGIKIDNTFMKKLLKSEIVKEIIEWAENRKKLEEIAALRALTKEAAKSSVKNIPKYEPASQKINRHECSLFICEGDSAKNPLLSARDPDKHGIFALRGKPLNIAEAKIDRIKKNEEIQNLTKALGLDFSGSVDNLRYGRIILACDADHDGSHIVGLMLNNFSNRWRELLEAGMVYRLITPIIRVTAGKETLEFFTDQEFNEWFNTTGKTLKKPTIKYLKGLGGNTTDHFKKFMFDEKYLQQLAINDDADVQYLELAFGAAKNKKNWLYPDFEG